MGEVFEQDDFVREVVAGEITAEFLNRCFDLDGNAVRGLGSERGCFEDEVDLG
ncbi:MAG: hypothetical protein GY952_17625 [Rhodobacteraceae bacterium]|nr:hypothetical protein [Paracoccaceae bacterium]